MSPKRLLATTTSREAGSRTTRATRASTRQLSIVICGNSAATSSNTVVPQRHPVTQRVGLRRARDVPSAVVARVLEGVADDPLDAVAGEHGGLDGELGRVPAVDAPAGARVLALGVLAHEDDVDVLRGDARERAVHAAQQPRGRRLTYWSKTWRRVRISPHTVTVSGSRGSPTGPRRIASNASSCSGPSAGIIAPSAR